MSFHNPAYYLSRALDPTKRAELLDRSIENIRETIGLDSFDTIAFTGVSGMLVGPELAHHLGKRMIAVRKDNDGTHSFNDLLEATPGNYEGCRYLIVDDLIASGRTVIRIQKVIERNFPFAVCAGTHLYNDRWTYDAEGLERSLSGRSGKAYSDE